MSASSSSENAGEIFWFISARKPPGLNVPMISAMTGMPMPESRKPRMAGVNMLPDSKPRDGGNIRLPAPKNMPKSMRPIWRPFLNIGKPLSFYGIYVKP
jgi:hypothetical protein